LSSFTQTPTSGRLMTRSSRLPIHIDTISPQNSSGCCVITCGPGAMPWIVIAPIISAIVAFEGRPRVSMGMNDVWAAELLAASGAATPRMSPCPNVPCLSDIFFSRT